MKKIHIFSLFMILLLALTGCAKEQTTKEYYEIEGEGYVFTVTVEEKDGEVRIQPAFKNSSDKEVEVHYGADIVDIKLDGKEIVDAYRRNLLIKKVGAGDTFEFKELKTEKVKWVKAKEITADISFEIDKEQINNKLKMK